MPAQVVVLRINARRQPPVRQQARPLSRNALYQILQRNLRSDAPLILDPIQMEAAPLTHRARILLVEDNPVNQLVAS